MTLDKRLASLLACPKCRGQLTLLPDGDGLLCAACSLVYPIANDIPVMLVEEAVPLAEWRGGRPK